MDRWTIFLVAVISACFVTMIALNIHWTTSNTFVPSSTSVALYQSDTCAASSYKIVIGPNETCISTSSGGGAVVLYDNNTFIFSTSDPSRYLSFLIGGAPSTTTTLYTTQTVNRSLIAPDFDGTILVQQTGTGFVFIGQTAQDHGSNAGIQLSSLTPNRAQLRLNQYGANAAGPGVTGFKSRSTTIGVSQSVLVGDLLWRTTAIGVAGDNSTIPLAGTISIIASAVGSNYVGTSYELALVDDEGIVNGRRPVFAVNSHGWPRWMESTSTNPQPAPKTPPSDLVILGAGGTITVPCHVIPANARIQLTVQPGQAPVGIVWVSAIVASTSFTISSTSALDAGVSVYYMISIPL